MSTEQALPEATEVAGAGEQAETVEQPNTEATETVETKPEAEQKPEKTPEQREIERMRRKIDRLVRQREELRAKMPQDLRPAQNERDNDETDSTDELKLSRAELQKLVREEAERLAPTLKEQQAEIEHRKAVIGKLSKTWGQEKFDSLASELDEAFGGLADAKGRPKPATDAIFEAEDPAAVIEFLTDPDNADEAEAIGRMSAIQAGRAIAKLEDKIAAKKAEAKPKPSKAAAPIEPAKGSGEAGISAAPMSMEQYMAWANKQYAR